jgi:hypothetical protein
MNTMTNEELEKKREKQRIYNKRFYDKNREQCVLLHKELYKKSMMNDDYKKYLYERQKIARDKLKQENINAGIIIPKKRGRPPTLKDFMTQEIN